MASAVGQFPCRIFETQVQADPTTLQSYRGEGMEKGRGRDKDCSPVKSTISLLISLVSLFSFALNIMENMRSFRPPL